MSTIMIKSLLQQLCPDGVEYKKLGECATMKRGVRVVKSQLSSDGQYPVYQNSMTPLGYYEKYNFPSDTTFIISAGAAGDVGYSSNKFWAADDCWCFICPENLNSKYLYYLLMKKQDYLYSRVRKASIPRLSRIDVDKIKIPVPPLPVQEEIVRILDKFTELTAELKDQLTAELTARKKQYEYYQSSLLINNYASYEFCLSDICEMRAGKSISSYLISDNQTEEAPIPCYGGNGIRGYVAKANQHGEYPLIGRQGALCGNVNYAQNDFYATEHAVVAKPNEKVNARYLFYLLTSMKLNQYKSQGAQPGLAVKKLEELKVFLPPLPEQERIVAILDRFDALCNDLTSGLPAEIEARQKQYEYYRDKLLTFQEKVI